MQEFGHEKLRVYQASLEYVAFVYECADGLKGYHRHARDQWLRASQSIPLNIAEGNGKSSPADRRRFFEIARGSALECGAVQDVLNLGGAISPENHLKGKALLHKIVAMVTKLGAAQGKS